MLWFSRMQMLLIALNFSLLDCLNLSQGSGISLICYKVLSCAALRYYIAVVNVFLLVSVPTVMTFTALLVLRLVFSAVDI